MALHNTPTSHFPLNHNYSWGGIIIIKLFEGENSCRHIPMNWLNKIFTKYNLQLTV